MSSDPKNYGPLALQMGTVTGAVDDLVHGYEQLMHTLPELSQKVAQMHSGTENMAIDLEVQKHKLFLHFASSRHIPLSLTLTR